jgi:glycosyltransferase involved in cell wall biosynthesis
MQNLPLVSIVTPTYNQAKYLAETIESVLAQNYPNIEYIVLDDGSKDDTPEVLKQYDGRIRHERHENMGQANTLNRGWGMASGSLIGYLSSDDILYPNAIEHLVAILGSDPSIVCVYPDSDLIDINSKVIKRHICRPFDLDELVVRQECYIGPGALFRRDAFKKVGGWRPELKLAPDREFWIRLAGQGKFSFCAHSLAGYRMHPKSISYKDVSEDIGREYIWFLDQYFGGACYLPTPSIKTRKSEAYGYATLVLARNCLRAGRWRRGLELYREACHHYPPLSKLVVKVRLFKNVVSKPVRTTLASLRFLMQS